MRLFPHLGPGAFRLLLALLVVASHLSSLALGRPAVFAFFTLSGYWVLRMYEQKYRPATTVPVFYLSRVLRIWLPFASAYLLVMLLLNLTGSPRGAEYLQSLLVFGIASTGRDVLGVSWSLDIEMQFYLAVPLLWLVLQRRLPWSGMLSGVLLLTGLGWGLLLGWGLWTFLAFLPCFAAGGLIWATRFDPGPRLAALSAAGFLGIGALLYLIPETRSFVISGEYATARDDILGMAWVMVLVPFIAWNVQQKSNALDMHMGNYSYALYITHWPVIALVGPLLAPVSILDKLVLLAVIGVVSILFYLAVDRPMEGLRRRVVAAARDQRPKRRISSTE